MPQPQENEQKTPSNPLPKWLSPLFFALTLLYTAAFCTFSFLPKETWQSLVKKSTELTNTVVKLLIGTVFEKYSATAWWETFLQFLFFALLMVLPTWFAWLAARHDPKESKKALLPAAYVGALLSVLGVLLPAIRGTSPDFKILAFLLCGMLLMDATIFVCILLPREIVDYVIAGLLATAVNLIAFNICDIYCKMPTWLSTSIAWVVAAAFAYVTNKVFVFHSKTHGMKELLVEAGMFFGARGLTFAIDLGGMLLLADYIKMSKGIAKILCNIIVLVLNYIFSKVFIFNKGSEDKDKE